VTIRSAAVKMACRLIIVTAVNINEKFNRTRQAVASISLGVIVLHVVTRKFVNIIV